MPRKKKETYLFYGNGDDEVQIDSFDKKLNADVLKLAEKEKDAVEIIDDSEKPDYLRAAVKNQNLSVTFRRTPSQKTKKSQSENGKRHTDNLKHLKRGK